jgi:ATP synthase protein I
VIAVLGLQLAVFTLLSVGAALIFGVQHGLHLMLGGLAAWVPSALFALRLLMQRRRRPESHLPVFFVGEFVKIGLTVGFIVLTAYNVPDLQWMPWLIGLIASIKVPLLFGIRVR